MSERSMTSKRLDYNEMRTLLNMMNIAPFILEEANKLGNASIGTVTVRKTNLEQLFTITFAC